MVENAQERDRLAHLLYVSALGWTVEQVPFRAGVDWGAKWYRAAATIIAAGFGDVASMRAERDAALAARAAAWDEGVSMTLDRFGVEAFVPKPSNPYRARAAK